MRCSYCYAGAKLDQAMPEAVGRRAIDRAVASLAPGGVLEMGFFGGEPLLEAELVSGLASYARERAATADVRLSLALTTNGAVAGPAAWAVMSLPDLDLVVSHDGVPEVHDWHRRSVSGRPTSARVLATIDRCLAAGRSFRVVMVVRPDTVRSLPAGVQFLRGLGVRHLEPTLDLWAQWTPGDGRALDAAISRCADIWRSHIPELSIGWLDEKAAVLTGVPQTPTARCGFGVGQVAVTPSGNLYPCERLIGEDDDGNVMRLPGHVSDGEDFLFPRRCGSCRPCVQCAIRAFCNTTCRCSNYTRTGDLSRPDGLLCLLNRACVREVARVLRTGRSARGFGPSRARAGQFLSSSKEGG